MADIEKYENVTPANLQNHFQHQIEEFIWITQVDLSFELGYHRLRVVGTIKPVGVELEDSAIAVRHKILLSYECVLEIVGKLGGEHWSYPDLEITGQVVETLGGEQKLLTEGKLELDLRIKSNE